MSLGGLFFSEVRSDCESGGQGEERNLKSGCSIWKKNKQNKNEFTVKIMFQKQYNFEKSRFSFLKSLFYLGVSAILIHNYAFNQMWSRILVK